MNYLRLARAMNTSVFVVYEILDQEHFVRKWFFPRCAICGKAEVKYGEFIAQAGGIIPQAGGAFVYMICQDHGGTTGKVYSDCLTGEAVEVSPSPNLLTKAIRDPMQELAFWARVWLKYYALFVFDAFCILRHPLAYLKYRKKING